MKADMTLPEIVAELYRGDDSLEWLVLMSAGEAMEACKILQSPLFEYNAWRAGRILTLIEKIVAVFGPEMLVKRGGWRGISMGREGSPVLYASIYSWTAGEAGLFPIWERAIAEAAEEAGADEMGIVTDTITRLPNLFKYRMWWF